MGSGTGGARPINESATGSGTYELSGRRANLTETRIRLHNDGRAELSFDGNRSVGGRGTWRRGAGGRADIALSEWDGRRTNGTAAVTFRGNAIERIGVNVTSQNARVEFFPGRSDAGDNWGGIGGGNTGAQPINLSTTGSGTYEMAGRRSSLNEMRIRLRDDGRAELRFDGDRSVEGQGTWRRGYNGRAEIDVTEWNGRRTGGTAAVTYRGREIDRVDVNVPSQRARIEFQPTKNGGGVGAGNNTAQPVNTSFVGSGDFRDRGRVYRLEEASVRLRDDGEAELRFEGQRRTGGRGSWRRFGAYAALTIVEWDGQRTSGTGNVAFTRNQPTQVTVTLQGGRSLRFSSLPSIQPR